jgi:hypothetical protein
MVISEMGSWTITVFVLSGNRVEVYVDKRNIVLYLRLGNSWQPAATPSQRIPSHPATILKVTNVSLYLYSIHSSILFFLSTSILYSFFLPRYYILLSPFSPTSCTEMLKPFEERIAKLDKDID